jgi:peptidyl-prolyl cis-trans isomerase SurA
MKKITFLVIVCLAATGLFSQALFTYGPYSVSREEFLRAYNKNKTAVANKEQSLREYLDLYTRFKLKVRAAKELRLDTLQQMQQDLQNFRSQVEEGYLTDEKSMTALIDEAMIRSRKDIHVLHYYIPLGMGASSADSIKAFNIMGELAAELRQKATGFDDIASGKNGKYPGVNARDLGYITALSLPYEIENLVYALEPGGLSKPYRSKSALHIFKHAGERRSAGRWKVAQILLSIPPQASDTVIRAVAAKADSIYQLLVQGADFAALAKQFSEDKLTYMNGGEIPEFGTGKFELPFEEKVFALKADGDISRPIFTGYGFHIVKRLEHRDIPEENTDEGFGYTLKQQILADGRVNAANEAFLRTVKVKSGFKRNAAVSNAELFRFADSITGNKNTGKYPISNNTIFSFKKSAVRGAEWLNFIRDFKLNPDVYKGENNAALLEKFINSSCLDYYRRHLEEYSQDFRYQMEEFKEGNMLFEIMDRNVWGKAANDSMGLRQYYEAHKEKYQWAASAAVLLFSSSDPKAVNEAVTALNSGKDWKQVVDESDGKLQADSGRFELAQIQLSPGTLPKEGLISPPYTPSGDNTSSFVKLLKLFPAGQQRSFEEAKGMVINDYQTVLEEKWVEKLKKNYPVKLNQVVFASLFN